MKNKITVVIVTFNGSPWIEKCISSIKKSNFAVDIIVIENASADETCAILEKFSEIEIIKNPTNLGFGKANNIGIKRALKNGADAVFLLNQDTWIFENTIGNLAQAMNNHPEFGIISPMHFAKDGVHLDQNFETYLGRKINSFTDKNLTQVPFINACAWLVTKKCFEKVGFFEPIFNHYGEDRNFCDRVLYHNFKIGIIDDAKICHDRVITRSFQKDILQSRYKILSCFLNINRTLFFNFFAALKNVVGLPKYFLKFHGWAKSIKMLLNLSFYYLEQIFNLHQIIKIRQISKQGKNGF